MSRGEAGDVVEGSRAGRAPTALHRLLGMVTIVCAAGPVRAADPERFAQVMGLLEASHLEQAAPLVEAVRAVPGMGPLLRGTYDFYRGAYAEAAQALEQALTGDALDPSLVSEAKELRDLAKATDAVTHGFLARRSEHFEIKVAPGKDELIAEPALEALEQALAVIGGDLDHHPPGPIRVEIYGEIADLAKVSPLTIAEIETSGTIALCKYNRLMATSPRALVAGYAWLDTLAHELTHYLVSRASRNTVPIWLHEGIAKNEERRWRESFGGALPPLLEHLLADGLKQNHLIPFSAMHPSMAKLPSQEDAGLAFAEVTTAVRFLVKDGGPNKLRRLLRALRDGAELSRALQQVTGMSMARFEQRWRGWLSGQGLRLHPELGLERLRFRRPGVKQEEDEVAHGPARTPEHTRARGHTRLGSMLRTRGRLGAAALQYERAITLLGSGHPDVASRLARTYLELHRWDQAATTARAGLERRPDSAGLRVTLGTALLEKADMVAARAPLEQALAINPFDPQTRCGLARVYKATSDPRATREASACSRLGAVP